MIGYLGYRAARGQVRMYRKSRNQPGGPWTVTAVLFCILPFTVLWMLVLAVQFSGLFWVLLGVNVLLALLAAGPLITSRAAVARASAQYERQAAKQNWEPSGDELLERAVLLEELEAAQVPFPAPAEYQVTPAPAPEREPDPWRDDLRAEQAAGAAERAARVARLFTAACPEETCKAPVTVPCNMGIGIPVALVDKQRVLFCHLLRMRDAVRYGSAAEDDILAQFGNNVPEGIL